MLSNIIPNILVGTAIVVSSISALISNPANAGQRYGTPPPAVLSQDLMAPWVLQLRIPPPRHNRLYGTGSYQVQIAPPVVHRARVYQPVAQPRTYQRRQPVIRQTIAPVYSTPKSAPVVVKAKSTGRQLDSKFEPQIVTYSTGKSAGTIVIDTNDKFLYLVMGDGQARRYGVGVGKPGFEWAGTHKITRKAEWPTWRPPAQMIAREKKKGRDLPRVVKGGPKNPLGARALYLGSTLYRIHGTNSPWTIGKAVSSGCIRMRNEDVMDLYERVGVGTRVIVS